MTGIKLIAATAALVLGGLTAPCFIIASAATGHATATASASSTAGTPGETPWG